MNFTKQSIDWSAYDPTDNPYLMMMKIRMLEEAMQLVEKIISISFGDSESQDKEHAETLTAMRAKLTQLKNYRGGAK
jgi:hypothetical protein